MLEDARFLVAILLSENPPVRCFRDRCCRADDGDAAQNDSSILGTICPSEMHI